MSIARRPHRPDRSPLGAWTGRTLFLALVVALCLALPAGSAVAAIQPHLLSLSSNSGVPGNTVTLTGYGFGATQAGTSSVAFGGAIAAVTSWSDTQITATVPAPLVTYGAVYVFIVDSSVGGYDSNELPFIIEDPALWLEQVTPSHGAAGAVVKLTGHGFGAAKGSSNVIFPGAVFPTLVPPITWSDTSITFTLPAGMAVGQHEVFVNAIGLSNRLTFNVDPAIASLSPAKARPGATVTVNGTGFGRTRGTSKVLFGKTAATKYLSWSDTKIKVRVPATSAGSKPVKVVTRFGTSATKGFKVV
jgi:hypothetical protein